MQKIWISLFTLLVIAGQLSSQTLDENKRKYNNAKELFKLGNYDLAMEAFKQVASERPENPYYQYASYFYTLSAVKANRLSEAKLMVAQMENKYPNWSNINEVRYLGAEVAFRERNPAEALSYLKKIGKGFDQEDIKNLSSNYLSKINSVDSLKKLHTQFPESALIGEVLANKILKQPLYQQDSDLLKSLVKEYKLDTAKFASALKFQTKKKPAYNVALLFPFMVEELNAETLNRPNFYALDMYEGIKLGNAVLAKQGIKLNLFTFDTGKDNQKLTSVLERPELANMDFIIGPLTNSPVPSFENFILKNGILATNPITSNSKLLDSNPFLYLTDPTFENIANSAANFIIKTYAPKKVAIFYGGTSKDSILASNYQKTMIANKSQVVAYTKITSSNVAALSRVLSDSLHYNLNNIFMSTSEQTVAANFISEVEKNRYKIPVVSFPQLMDYKFFNLNQFERLNLHFPYPAFIDYTKPSVNEFRKQYQEMVHIVPSVFAYIGYDLIQLFGNQLYKNGTNFQKGIGVGAYLPGYTLSGYDFSKGNSNSFTPIVKFQEGKLEIENIPTTK